MTDEQSPSQPQDTPDQDAEAQDAGSQPAQPHDLPPSGAEAIKMDLGGYLSAAWNLVTADFVLLVIGYAVIGLIMSVPLVGLIIGGPLIFGYLRVVQKRYRGEAAAFGELFAGFQDFTKGLLTMLLFAAIIVGEVIIVLILSMIPIIGWLAAIALDLAVGAAIFFILPLAALSEASPTEAVSRSFKFCLANFWPMILLSFVTGLIAMAGMLACGIGMVFTVPIALAAAVAAYNQYYLPKAQDAT